ncbi:MAG: hypothetical protein ABIP38_15635 [Steroidobacteraceae bacterium]
MSITALAVSALAGIHYWRGRIPPSLIDSRSAFQRMDGGASQLVARSLRGTSGPSVLLLAAGRGQINGFSRRSPEMSGEPLELLGGPHAYRRWQQSGTALYGTVFPAGTPAGDLRLTTAESDEATLMAVHVAGSKVADVSWVEREPSWRITSAPVITRGAATLVAFWWGDAGVRYRKSVVPGNGFRLLDSVLDSGALVQAATAVRHVDAAGTYAVTWTAWPKQGGQLWLIAIE